MNVRVVSGQHVQVTDPSGHTEWGHVIRVYAHADRAEVVVQTSQGQITIEFFASFA